MNKDKYEYKSQIMKAFFCQSLKKDVRRRNYLPRHYKTCSGTVRNFGHPHHIVPKYTDFKHQIEPVTVEADETVYFWFQKPDKYCCISPSLDRPGFYADIQKIL